MKNYLEVSIESQRVGEYSGENNDCTVRALAAVACVPYGAAHRSCELVGRQRNHGIRPTQITQLLGDKFANYKVERVLVPVRTVAQFQRMFRTGRYYVVISGHALALIDGVWYDSAPPRPRARVRYAWKLTAI